jgi:hypothetical protein
MYNSLKCDKDTQRIKMKWCRKNEDLCWFVLGAIVLFAALSPFWIFGHLSALGFYDETNSRIPAGFVQNHLAVGAKFVHSWAGGQPFAEGYGLSKLSFYRLLTNNFDLWISNLIFRFLGLFTFFVGFYRLVNLLFDTPKFVLCI